MLLELGGASKMLVNISKYCLFTENNGLSKKFAKSLINAKYFNHLQIIKLFYSIHWEQLFQFYIYFAYVIDA